MTSPLSNYLKAHRKRLGLRQADISVLLGSGTNEQVCRHETFVRIPGLEDALAYEAIYNKGISELFAGLYQKIQKEVASRAKSVSGPAELENPGRTLSQKFDVLAEISTRIANKLETHD